MSWSALTYCDGANDGRMIENRQTHGYLSVGIFPSRRTMKICCRCKQNKLLSEFSPSRPRCRICDAEIARAYRNRNKEWWKDRDPYAHRIAKQCPKCGQIKPVQDFSRYHGHSDGLSCWCRKCDIQKKQLLKYGRIIDLEDTRCEICGDPATHVDHDHKIGKPHVRGTLCYLCNVGLGSFRDRPELLTAAVSYLTRG